jgi:hypothetical protein
MPTVCFLYDCHDFESCKHSCLNTMTDVQNMRLISFHNVLKIKISSLESLLLVYVLKFIIHSRELIIPVHKASL